MKTKKHNDHCRIIIKKKVIQIHKRKKEKGLKIQKTNQSRVTNQQNLKLT
jgi:hypothetical protein